MPVSNVPVWLCLCVSPLTLCVYVQICRGVGHERVCGCSAPWETMELSVAAQLYS